MKNTLLISLVTLLISTSALGFELHRSLAFKRLEESTLHIARGTGSIAKGKSGKLYILTVWHVCNTSSDGYIHGVTHDGRSYFGKIVKYNIHDDVCAVSLSEKDIPALEISRNFIMAAPVHYRGYPLGVLLENSGYLTGVQAFPISYPIEEVGECRGMEKLRDAADRVVACKNLFINYSTTFFGRGGSSGSPVVDNNGDLIGLVDTGSADGKLGIVTYPALRRFMDTL